MWLVREEEGVGCVGEVQHRREEVHRGRGDEVRGVWGVGGGCVVELEKGEGMREREPAACPGASHIADLAPSQLPSHWSTRSIPLQMVKTEVDS